MLQNQAEKKLAVLRSRRTAKYHLQTAITPFAFITYMLKAPTSISKGSYFEYVEILN